MRKLFGILLAFVMCLASFAGCARTGDGIDYELLLAKFDGDLEQNVTIKVLENDTAIKMGYLKTVLNAFNAEYKNKGIVAVEAKVDEFSDLATDGPYGLAPDLLYQANDILMPFAAGMHLLPLPIDKLDTAAELSNTALKPFVLNKADKNYTFGVPVAVQAPMLYYRKDMLPKDWKTNYDKNKNDIPDFTENWSDMYKYSKSVRDIAAKKFGIMMSMQNVYFNSGFIFSFGGYVFGGNNDDTYDVGYGAGEAEKGGQMMRQLASVMDETCIDDSITVGGYNKLGKGDFFATVSTPDTYERYISEFIKEQKGKTPAEAETYARENLIIAEIPRVPISGDLTLPITNIETETKEMVCMGGVNGYGISAYTEYPKACLEFINFATKYEMILERTQKLGIAAAREDVAEKVGGLSKTLFRKIDNGMIKVMPSVKEVAQLWKPGETFFADLAKDPYKKPADVEYDTLPKIKAGLEQMSKNIYDSIHALE